MNIDEIWEHHRYEYVQTCPTCTMEMKVLTQKDSFPEYHTEIYVQCQCGEYLEFILPVN
jgi:hypothetical protein